MPYEPPIEEILYEQEKRRKEGRAEGLLDRTLAYQVFELAAERDGEGALAAWWSWLKTHESRWHVADEAGVLLPRSFYLHPELWRMIDGFSSRTKSADE